MKPLDHLLPTYRSFRVMYTLVMAAHFLYGLLFMPTDFPLAIFFLPFIPIAASFGYPLLFGQEHGYHLILFVLAILIFIPAWPFSSLFGFVAIPACLLAAAWYERMKSGGSMDTWAEDPRWDTEGEEQSKTMEEVLIEKKRETIRRINRYQKRYQQAERQLKQTQSYLDEVETDLQHPHLSDENRRTSEQLKTSLKLMVQQEELITRFFSRVLQHYERHRYNLDQKLRHRQILTHLQQQQPADQLRDTEQALLSMEFEDEIERLQAELPIFDATLESHAELLNQDLQADLKRAIDRLG